MINGSEWDTFYRSGKVEDYLNYCQNKEQSEEVKADRGLKEEHAELYCGFRTGAESGAHRGI